MTQTILPDRHWSAESIPQRGIAMPKGMKTTLPDAQLS